MCNNPNRFSRSTVIITGNDSIYHFTHYLIYDWSIPLILQWSFVIISQTFPEVFKWNQYPDIKSILLLLFAFFSFFLTQMKICKNVTTLWVKKSGILLKKKWIGVVSPLFYVISGQNTFWSFMDILSILQINIFINKL